MTGPPGPASGPGPVDRFLRDLNIVGGRDRAPAKSAPRVVVAVLDIRRATAGSGRDRLGHERHDTWTSSPTPFSGARINSLKCAPHTPSHIVSECICHKRKAIKQEKKTACRDIHKNEDNAPHRFNREPRETSDADTNTETKKKPFTLSCEPAYGPPRDPEIR